MGRSIVAALRLLKNAINTVDYITQWVARYY